MVHLLPIGFKIQGAGVLEVAGITLLEYPEPLPLPRIMLFSRISIIRLDSGEIAVRLAMRID
jgi:hypothetical protein